ncbi:hypothetical protein VSN93_06020 [Acinetobacter johnsonii]|uniref:hypothetical protein n=1 Tax=Acinetobacter johnsonii TaxID=40214 RepID=UPI003D179659
MVQEFIHKEITILIPTEDAKKIEDGELNLYSPQIRKKGKIIKHLDTLISNENFYAKNSVIQINNHYAFADSLYSKKLKAQITQLSDAIKKNEQLSQKIIQLQYNEIEAKVIKFNIYLEQSLESNIFSYEKVIEIGIDTLSTLSSNFSYLIEDYINSTIIDYNKWGNYEGKLSLLEYTKIKDKKNLNISKTEFIKFSEHIVYFITLSLLNTLNDVNITLFKKSGKLLKNCYTDLQTIKEKLINTLNTLISGIKESDDIYNISYHIHNDNFFPLHNLEKIISLDKRDNINIHQLIIRQYNNTSDKYDKKPHPIDHNRVNSINTTISLIDLCDDIINRFQTLEEMQEDNPDFNQLLIELSEYTITLSESGDS